jgi:DNA-binding CsgD family transcriptional regulator
MKKTEFIVTKRLENDIKRLVAKGKDEFEIALILNKKQSYIIKCFEKLGL